MRWPSLPARRISGLAAVAFCLLFMVLSASNGQIPALGHPVAAAVGYRPQAAFTPGNLVIYRVGTGAAALSSSATPVFLDEYTPAGVLVQSIPLPTATSGSNRRLTSSGTAILEGLMTRSIDGRYLLLTGYDASVGTATVASSSSSTTNRVVGRIDSAGSVDTTTALSDMSDGNSVRSVASTNGTALWVTGAADSIHYATLGATTSTQLTSLPLTVRQVHIFNGQLYISAQSNPFRVATVGTGLPTTAGQTTTNLPGFPTTTGSPNSFFFADLSAAVPGLDTLYVADDSGLIQKYALVGGNWTAQGSVVAPSAARGLTGVVTGTSVTLYVTGDTAFSTVTDSSGYNVSMTGSVSTLATAAGNTAFRGVAFAPVAALTATPTITPTPTVTPTATPCGLGQAYTVTTGAGTIVSGVTDIGNHTDDGTTTITLPFAVRLYGNVYTTAMIGSNGTLAFGTSDNAFTNTCLPSATASYEIFPYWDDLCTANCNNSLACTSCGIFTTTVGSNFYIEWRTIQYANGASVNFELVLTQGSPNFQVIYGPGVTDSGSETIGVQDAGTSPFTQYKCNTAAPAITAGLQLNFSISLRHGNGDEHQHANPHADE